MQVRYLLSNTQGSTFGPSGMITKPVPPPPGMTTIATLTLDTPPPPKPRSNEPRPLPQPMLGPQLPHQGAGSEMIQPTPQPAINEAIPAAPEPPPGPQPKWVNEGKYNIWRTVAAAGTVAALFGLGFAFLKK